jgi:hypothetical protein
MLEIKAQLYLNEPSNEKSQKVHQSKASCQEYLEIIRNE